MIAAGADRLIIGMALGWDTDIARASREIGFPYIAAVPHRGQCAGWDRADQIIYSGLLDDAERVETLNVGYIERDKWIVDNCEQLWSLNSGRPSGSNTTERYALQSSCKVVRLWYDWLSTQTGETT